MSSSNPFPLIIGALAGLGAYFYGLALYHIYNLIKYTPTSKAVSAAPGITEVCGKAKPFGELKTSPYNQKSCVFFETAIYKWHGSGKNRSRSMVRHFWSKDPFYLEDDTGAITIQSPLEAGSKSTVNGIANLLAHHKMTPQNYLKRDINASAVPSTGSIFGAISNVIAMVTGGKKTAAPEPPPESTQGKLRAFLRAEYPDLLDYGDRVDVEETYIEPGDSIYVLGTAAVQQAGEGSSQDSIMVGYDPSDGVFVISDGSEKDARGATEWGTILAGLGGPLLFGFCTWAFFAYFKWIVLDLVGLLVLLMYAGLLLVNLLELYNGTIRLRQNIEKAKANLDALYQMRHDLVPNLVLVVETAAKREKSLQTEIANLRAMQLEEADKTVVALAENYPILQSNQNFITLQKQLAEIQEKLAGSQSYVVDATTLYNQRVQSFPYFLMAPMMGLKPMPMPAMNG